MAETKETKASTKSASETKKADVETKFKKEKFINNAKALGYEKYVVAGAFSNVEKDEFTKKEFEELMKNFLGKKVK